MQLLIITSANSNRFSKFFHWQIQKPYMYRICDRKLQHVAKTAKILLIPLKLIFLSETKFNNIQMIHASKMSQ